MDRALVAVNKNIAAATKRYLLMHGKIFRY